MNEKDTIRFWSKVDKSGGPEACWPWRDGLFSDGYGQFRMQGCSKRAHRLAFGEGLDKSLQVLHSCDNPICCNPAHLRQGTHCENMQDKADRDRIKGEKNPRSKLTPKDVLEIRSSTDTQTALGLRFNVTHTTVGKIKRLESWAHLPLENADG